MSDGNIRSTTILGVRIGSRVALGGDGQITFGDIQMKSKAVKVRSYADGRVLAGFAGAAADAMALFEKFETKLDEMHGNLKKAVVDLAKDWRTDKILRELDALLAIMDAKNAFILSGSGDVIEPDNQIVSIGSGSGYALAAASAFIKSGVRDPIKIVRDSLKITAKICIYTNDHITILENQ
ncbi:MAG: ATP-dependent protease subunit HslV [FCB group bacterium]|nr:ATP-dependent protease subunit HslV [FCB group bacterium]